MVARSRQQRIEEDLVSSVNSIKPLVTDVKTRRERSTSGGGFTAIVNSVVKAFLSDPSERRMRMLVRRVQRGIADEEIACLATGLATSGAVLPLPYKRPTADLASTGGPSSLSTILCPLHLATTGLWVPKLGVPGRPAGALDVLAQLPGYRVDLSECDILRCLERCGYANFAANDQYTPLDARLFDFRRRAGYVASPELAMASILAKKIAVNVGRVGLDIRVGPHGNFGSTWGRARENAIRFRRIALLTGIDVKCFLTDGMSLYQPFVGRGESLWALKSLFAGCANQALSEHGRMCVALARTTASGYSSHQTSEFPGTEHVFYDNLRAQGSSRDEFDACIHTIRKGHQYEVVAEEDGFLSVRVGDLRDLMIEYQCCGVDPAKFPDGMGMVFHSLPGDWINRSELIATLRLAGDQWRSVIRRLKRIVVVSREKRSRRDFEEVGNG